MSKLLYNLYTCCVIVPCCVSKGMYCFDRCVFCKVKLEDYEGALHDADNVVTNFEKSFLTLQERGVVKEMMGDYEGAIEDLTKALRYGGPNYECLKHQAFALFKFQVGIGNRSPPRCKDGKPIRCAKLCRGHG
jgi:tetratricopeptide (TPR) repeat protein